VSHVLRVRDRTRRDAEGSAEPIRADVRNRAFVVRVLRVVRGVHARGHHAGADELVVRDADGNHDAEGNARRVVHVASSSVFKMQ
jgi:hypothetical protein